jgi:tetrahydromethanopterin S-methyltransferase subunit G
MLTKADLEQIAQIVKAEIEPIKQGLKKLERKIDRVESSIIAYFDKRDVDHEKRIKRIEDHVGFSHTE